VLHREGSAAGTLLSHHWLKACKLLCQWEATVGDRKASHQGASLQHTVTGNGRPPATPPMSLTAAPPGIMLCDGNTCEHNANQSPNTKISQSGGVVLVLGGDGKSSFSIQKPTGLTGLVHMHL